MASAQVRLKSAGLAEVLRSPSVRKATERRARKIAAAAGTGYEVTSGTWKRARSSVITATTAARRDNARRQTLLRSIGAAQR